MTLADLADRLGLQVKAARRNLANEVTGGYASDLISDVLAHGQEGNLWVTLQTHQNVVATASFKGLAAVVLVGGREPQEDTVEKAESEGVPILVSDLPAFELVGRLYQLGIRSTSRESAGAGR